MRLKRTHLNPNCTIGLLYINKHIVCFTLEDKVREIPDTPVEAWKVPNETAIPRGTYKVSLTYSNRFKKVLPILHEVPGFTGIRLHSGNFAGKESRLADVKIDKNFKILETSEYVEVIDD